MGIFRFGNVLFFSSSFVSKCICFRFYDCVRLFNDLILANYFAFGALLMQFRLLFIWASNTAFAVRFLLKQFAFSFGFLLLTLRPVYSYFHRLFGCLQIVWASNCLLWHVCVLHVTFGCIYRLIHLSFKDLPVHWYHLFVSI